MNFIKNQFINRHFVNYIIIGLIGSFITYYLTLVFSYMIGLEYSFIPAYIIALTTVYIINSFFNFKERINFNRIIKFYISYIPNFIIQYGLVIVLHNLLNYSKELGLIVAIGISVPITYLLVKIFAFEN